MPRDKTQTYERIIPAAREEFLEKGFEQASMRSIASRAGMSAAGIYRHFPDKEALFAELAEPAVRAVREWCRGHAEWNYERLKEGALEAMWQKGGERELVFQVIYPHFQAFKLLLCRSEGTRYADFKHQLAVMVQRETLGFLKAAREKGFPVREVREREFHFLLTAYMDALLEIVAHDLPREEAEHYLKTFQEFFYPGWRAVLGL